MSTRFNTSTSCQMKPRKMGGYHAQTIDASYTNLVHLVIVDEIHLLYDERGTFGMRRSRRKPSYTSLSPRGLFAESSCQRPQRSKTLIYATYFRLVLLSIARVRRGRIEVPWRIFSPTAPFKLSSALRLGCGASVCLTMRYLCVKTSCRCSAAQVNPNTTPTVRALSSPTVRSCGII